MNTNATTDPPANWRPTAEQQKRRRLAGFMQWMSEHRGIALADFGRAWRCWVEDVSEFWDAVREYFSVTGTGFNGSAFAVERISGAIWYPNARMNLTENMLRHTLRRQCARTTAQVRSSTCAQRHQPTNQPTNQPRTKCPSIKPMPNLGQ
jgi:acetoacetyl-CoA synthetase